MSLLNRPSDGMHSVLIVVYKLILAEKALPREKLLGLCVPKAVAGKDDPKPAEAFDPKQVSQTLNTWTKLGLFEEHEEKGITLHADIRRDERVVEQLPQVARRLVLRSENNKNLWAAEGAKAADFTRAIAWLLAQDAYAATFSGWDEVQRTLLQQVPRELIGDNDQDLRVITNRERWAPLKAWAVWLGFAWNGSFPNKALIVDPTAAVRDALPNVFPRARTAMVAEDFIGRLAEELPVLDRGVYRSEIEGRLKQQTGAHAWVPPPNEQLSTTLSRALLRLIAEGTLTSEDRADAPRGKIQLTGARQAVIQTISHLTFHPKTKS